MVRNPTFLPLWSDLAEAARRGGSEQVITVDEPGRLRLETAAGRPFCDVRIQKGHVGEDAHLEPPLGGEQRQAVLVGLGLGLGFGFGFGLGLGSGLGMNSGQGSGSG